MRGAGGRSAAETSKTSEMRMKGLSRTGRLPFPPHWPTDFWISRQQAALPTRAMGGTSTPWRSAGPPPPPAGWGSFSDVTGMRHGRFHFSGRRPRRIFGKLRNIMRPWLLGVILVVHALAQSPSDAAAGRRIFESQCALCHGQTGGGGRGPALNRPKLETAPDDEALRKLISEGLRDMPGAWQLHPDEVAGVAAYVRTLGALPQETVPGDAARGARIYAANGCGGCHMVAGQGAGFGPELTAIGARRSAAFLRRTILKPGETLPNGFLYVSAVPVSGAAVREPERVPVRVRGPRFGCGRARHPGQRGLVYHPVARCRRQSTQLPEIRAQGPPPPAGGNSHAVI